MSQSSIAFLALSPEHRAAFDARQLQQRAAVKTKLAESAVFRRLVSTLAHETAPELSDETWCNSRAHIKDALGWQDVADSDIEDFLAVILNCDAPTVDFGSAGTDERLPYVNMNFRHFGLDVWTMPSQASKWCIRRPKEEFSADEPDAASVQKGLAAVIGGLFEQAIQDDIAAFSALAHTPGALRAFAALHDKDDYEGSYFAFEYPLTQAVSGLARLVYPTNELAQFIVRNSGFVGHQVECLIREHEGSACCVDKTRFILKSYLRFARTGTPITLDFSQRYTYHLPQRVLTNHEDIVEFLKATLHLYFGHVDRYLPVRAALLAKMPPLPSAPNL